MPALSKWDFGDWRTCRHRKQRRRGNCILIYLWMFGLSRSIFYQERSSSRMGDRRKRNRRRYCTCISYKYKWKIQDKICLFTLPPSSQPAYKGSHMVSTCLPLLSTPPPPHVHKHRDHNAGSGFGGREYKNWYWTVMVSIHVLTTFW